jgi:hypothetical protein
MLFLCVFVLKILVYNSPGNLKMLKLLSMKKLFYSLINCRETVSRISSTGKLHDSRISGCLEFARQHTANPYGFLVAAVFCSLWFFAAIVFCVQSLFTSIIFCL